MRILLIEDDVETAHSLKELLSKYFVVDVSYTGKTGTYKSHLRDYRLIIMDYGLPDMDGVQACTYIRNNNITTPILFVTGRLRIADKVRAFNAGADDYLTKPYSSRELLARAQALIRRNHVTYSHSVLTLGPLVLDSLKRIVYHHKTRLKLSKKEFDLLYYLMSHKGQPLTRTQIMDHVWEYGDHVSSNTVDVHIRRLRDLIDRPFNTQLIKTVHGTGYCISAEHD